MTELPKEIAGYRVLGHLGTGAASDIYAVQDPRTKQVWALKHVLKHGDKDQRFIEQMETEYAVGTKLEHPYVRHIERIIRHRKRFKVVAASLVMEWADAETMETFRPRDLGHTVRVFQHVAEGLWHMHGRGFVHADMKPSNILAFFDDRVKIIDLGQACKIGTVKKRIQGTPGYMAPEQAHRQAITPRTDIYNFGATMYWILCREVIPTALPPKDDGNLFSGALDAEQVESPTPPGEKDPDIHPLLSKQILDCVKIEPDDRPESMEFVANRLEVIADILENGIDSSLIDDEETREFG